MAMTLASPDSIRPERTMSASRRIRARLQSLQSGSLKKSITIWAESEESV